MIAFICFGLFTIRRVVAWTRFLTVSRNREAGKLQAGEYVNVPVSAVSCGEYRAEIQITKGAPTGQVWVYVRAQSLQGSVYGRPVSGPPIDTASAQTEDTSGFSQVQIANSPTQLPTTVNLIILIAPALAAILVVSTYVIKRRKRDSTLNH